MRAGHAGAMTFAYPLAIIAASALVVASAGFGATYAWASNHEHSTILAAFAVIMALGLEAAKPLAVHALFDAVRGFKFGQAAALAVLAVVSISYSVAAELQLMARSRADAVSERQFGASSATDARAKRDAMQKQLDKIAPARTAAELDPLIAVKSAATKGNDCDTWLENVKLRAACLELAPLKAEHARAAQRAALTVKIEAADTALATAGPAKVADPSAAALATYLGALGWKVEPSRLGDWLVLVGVFALEVGSMFAIVLIAACRPNKSAHVSADVPPSVPVAPPGNTDQTPGTPALSAMKHPAPAADETPEQGVAPGTLKLSVAEDPAERLLAMLQTQGGEVFGSQRTIARGLGISPAQTNRVMHDLAADGRIQIYPTKQGTRIKLAA
jgi:hypothetical protein